MFTKYNRTLFGRNSRYLSYPHSETVSRIHFLNSPPKIRLVNYINKITYEHNNWFAFKMNDCVRAFGRFLLVLLLDLPLQQYFLEKKIYEKVRKWLWNRMRTFHKSIIPTIMRSKNVSTHKNECDRICLGSLNRFVNLADAYFFAEISNIYRKYECLMFCIELSGGIRNERRKALYGRVSLWTHISKYGHKTKSKWNWNEIEMKSILSSTQVPWKWLCGQSKEHSVFAMKCEQRN